MKNILSLIKSDTNALKDQKIFDEGKYFVFLKYEFYFNTI